MSSIDVYILGQKYTVKGDATEEHIQKIAAFVDAKIKEVYNTAPNVAPLKASILAALNIADELYRFKIEQDNITKHIEERTKVLSGLFET